MGLVVWMRVLFFFSCKKCVLVSSLGSFFISHFTVVSFCCLHAAFPFISAVWICVYFVYISVCLGKELSKRASLLLNESNEALLFLALLIHTHTYNFDSCRECYGAANYLCEQRCKTEHTKKYQEINEKEEVLHLDVCLCIFLLFFTVFSFTLTSILVEVHIFSTFQFCILRIAAIFNVCFFFVGNHTKDWIEQRRQWRQLPSSIGLAKNSSITYCNPNRSNIWWSMESKCKAG